MTKLTAEAEATLAAVAKIVRLANNVRATGGSEASCIAYDAAQAEENTLYEAMNAKGLTKAQWREYDRRSAAIYRGMD